MNRGSLWHWEKPSLGLVEFAGSRDNNIVPKEWVMEYWFRDDHETDPSKRYKGLNRIGEVDRTMHIDLYYSPDGMNWRPYEHNPVIDTAPRIGRWGPTEFMGWDPIRNVYAAHMENCLHPSLCRGVGLMKRLIGRAESPDMVHWSPPETILLPDELDTPDTEFYDFPVITYEGLYVGLLWIFRTNVSTHHPELAVSRDGIRYRREFRRPFIVRGGRGDFDSDSVYASPPLGRDGRIPTVYSGVNWRSDDSIVERGDAALGAIGVATSPIDGFVSVDGPKRQPGELVTRSFGFGDESAWRAGSRRGRGSARPTERTGPAGRRLVVNVKAAPQGGGPEAPELRVEILSANHEQIPGYTLADADAITTSGAAQTVSWQGRSDVSDLADTPIRLRFALRNARLYSFQFA